MRFPLLPFLLFLVAASTLNAQSATPEKLKTITEDDLKLGIYDAPIFQPPTRNVTARQAEDAAKDGELLFVLGPATSAPRKAYWSPSIIRMQLACRQKLDGDDALDLVLKMLEEQAAANLVVNDPR